MNLEKFCDAELGRPGIEPALLKNETLVYLGFVSTGPVGLVYFQSK